MKDVENLHICKLGYVQSWYIIHPKKLRILQGKVHRFHEVQS